MSFFRILESLLDKQVFMFIRLTMKNLEKGAFLIPYLLMLVFCGIPLFYMEILLGQFSSSGCITLFRICPLFKGTGFAIVIVNIICTVYYAVILSYPLIYVYRSFSLKLPWTDCNNAWNTPNCTRVEDVNAVWNATSVFYWEGKVSGVSTPADEFFHLEVLKISSGIHEVGGIVWPLFICLVIAWITVFLCILKGVKSVGKVVYFSATFPFVVLAILFFRGVTLPGAGLGISFYMYPEWKKLTDLKIWADAAMQIFYSLGPGWGGIVNMASYNDFRNNAKWDAIVIPIVNCFTSIFAGFVVFSVLGYLSIKTGIPVASVATSGPGLAYITYPEAIAMLRYPHFWSIIFFLMLFFLGLDSAFVQIEAVITSIIDEYKFLRKWRVAVTAGICFVMFLLSISMVTNGGMYILQLLDWYSASAAVILFCMIEVLIVGRIYGVKRFKNDIYFMTGHRLGKVWLFSWKCTTPIILILIFFTSVVFNRRITFNNTEYPDWAVAIGWGSCLSSIICIPIYMIYILSKKKGSLIERIREACYPREWYPAMPHHRKEYLRLRKIFETGAEVFGLDATS
ncbi:sodium- and chloride-dependent glycine transporter 1 isoform X2 [Hermetia illucens]|uniref:sodium- and chloride-dependent glycine transporter 1 isoform X2 n=1 Tax=Hermetia illucens TaxID=343691 RepID=UPI0018CC15F5|nr:sodium- and chloride-dependent glycine transporter 1 isoform X2 [Hermetia illucens]